MRYSLLLDMVFGVEQIFCQSTNVICFLLLAAVCFVIYAIKKMLDYRVILSVGIPAAIIAGLACVFSLRIHSNVLKIIFGAFIILVGLIMFFTSIFSKKTSR